MRFLFFALVLILFSSCDSMIDKICGQPKGAEKVFVDSFNDKFRNILKGQPTPCYPGYFQAHLLIEMESEKIDYIERLIMEQDYMEVLIYDKNNKLVRGNVGSM